MLVEPGARARGAREPVHQRGHQLAEQTARDRLGGRREPQRGRQQAPQQRVEARRPRGKVLLLAAARALRVRACARAARWPNTACARRYTQIRSHKSAQARRT